MESKSEKNKIATITRFVLLGFLGLMLMVGLSACIPASPEETSEAIGNEFFIGFIASIVGLVLIILIKKISQEKKEVSPEISFSQRLDKLTASLASSSEEVDKVLTEMTLVAKERNLALATLEAQIDALAKRESEMKTKVDELQKVSIPALDYFLQAAESSEERGAKRDYLLFFAGIVVSAIVSLILELTLGI